jgi:hypothetical protein
MTNPKDIRIGTDKGILTISKITKGIAFDQFGEVIPKSAFKFTGVPAYQWKSKELQQEPIKTTTKLDPNEFTLKEQILVTLFNNNLLSHWELLNLFKSDYFGVGTYCRWMEYLGLKEDIETKYAELYYDKIIEQT